MSLEDRVKNCFKIEKAHMYRWNNGEPTAEGMNDVWLHLASKFKMRVREVKDIVYPNGWMKDE